MPGDSLLEGVSGSLGGILALFSTYPLITATTLRQTAIQRQHYSPSDGGKSTNESKHSSNSDFHILLRIIKEDGFHVLYAGLQPALVGTCASQGVYYYFYSLLRKYMITRRLNKLRTPKCDPERQALTVPESLLVSSMSGCINVFLTYPIWTTISRIQTQRTSLSATVLDLYRSSGFKGFYKGFLPALIMVSNPVVQFAIYETLLKWYFFVHRGQKTRPSALFIFLSGAIAKFGATILTYPLQVVKSSMQVSKGPLQQASTKTTTGTKRNSGSGMDSGHLDGTWKAFFRLLKSQGLRPFFIGLNIKLLQSVLATAILFMSRDQILRFSQKIVQVLVERKNNSGVAAVV